MSRSGYVDYGDDDLGHALWRAAVSSAMRGARGQAFLREMLMALDAMPIKRLIKDELESDGEVCAIGAVGKVRGIDMRDIDPDDYERIADTFGIARAMACELMFYNDEWKARETPEARFVRMRAWVERLIVE